MDALKRAMRWDERAFGREYDLDIFMIVAVSDFNMGAMENKGLNIFNDKYCWRPPRPRPTTTTPASKRRGARIFPQLDRQPHHLPRLVPALPEGRPHRLPRPGILRRRALAAGAAHPGCARPARASVRRGCRSARPSGAPDAISRDQQFLHRRPSTRRAPRSSACCRPCSAPQQFRKGMDLYFERHDGEAATVEEFVQCFADASGRDLVAVHAVVRAGRHARDRRHRRLRCARQDLPSRACTDAAADARPAHEGADGDPARHRARGAGRPRPAAAACRR